MKKEEVKEVERFIKASMKVRKLNIKQERKKIIKKYIQLFFGLALIMCFMVWVDTGFRDLRKPYISVYCSEDNFKDCVNPYYEHCKLNDCSLLDPEIYANKLVKVGESIGENPPQTLYILPTALTLLAFLLSILCFREIDKNDLARKINREKKKRIKQEKKKYL